MRALTSIFKTTTSPQRSKGFTLVETLIAGVLLTLVMTAVGRMSASALAGSSNLAEQRRIEEAIENHIQLVQQADSLLNGKKIPTNHLIGSDSACHQPAAYLAAALEQQGTINENNWRNDTGNFYDVELFPAFQMPKTDVTAIETKYSANSTTGIVTVKYSYQSPHSKMGLQTRTLELSPNFQSECAPH